jgi:hypothetical protein
VSFFKVRDGEDQKLDTVTTNAEGAANLEAESKGGHKYYAKTPAVKINGSNSCTGDTSKRVTAESG